MCGPEINKLANYREICHRKSHAFNFNPDRKCETFRLKIFCFPHTHCEVNASLRANHIGPYLIQSQIGSGSYAEVLKVRHIRGSVDLAMKIYSKSDLANPDILNHYSKEVAILSKVHHPFIVEVFDLVETADYKAIVMELVDGGNLLDYSNNHHLAIDEVQRIFGQLVSTLSYLHRSQICHGGHQAREHSPRPEPEHPPH